MSAGPAVLNNPENPSLSAAPKDRRQYTCLCGFMHLRTAALLIGVVEAICVLIALISVIVRYSQGTAPVGSLVVVLISAVIAAMALACLFLAIRRQQPPLLLPHIAIQILATIALLILAIILSVKTISTALHSKSIENLGSDIGILVVVLLATGINTWFTVVMAKYYHFLKGNL